MLIKSYFLKINFKGMLKISNFAILITELKMANLFFNLNGKKSVKLPY